MVSARLRLGIRTSPQRYPQETGINLNQLLLKISQTIRRKLAGGATSQRQQLKQKRKQTSIKVAMTLSRPPFDPQTKDKADNGVAETGPDFGRGLSYLKAQVKTLPHQPGVYRMTGAEGEALYLSLIHI